MKVLVNFAPLKVGGGQNVAMNFLHAVASNPSLTNGVELSYLVAKDSAPYAFLAKAGEFKYHVMSRNAALRILQEAFWGSYILWREKYDVVYSCFGFGSFLNRTPQVSGSADSNLFFPEIDFWHHYRGLGRAKKWLVDLYRAWNLRRATAVVFESELIEERARKIYGLTSTKVIRPSINISPNEQDIDLSVISEGRPRGLFLCGWQLNKNVLLIPSMVAELKRRGTSLHVLITAPADGSEVHQQFVTAVKRHGVEDLVHVIGQVRKEQLASLFRNVDVVFLLSKLESFSNNIIEAWHYEKPLVISGEQWARAICGDAAIYVDRDSPADIAEKVVDLLREEACRASIVARGKVALGTYPTIEMRVAEEIEYIKHVYKTH